MAKIIGKALPNIPWEPRPADCRDVVWRYSQNPIVPRDAIPCSNSIFNSAVVPYKDGFAGVFRCDDKRREMRIHSAHSRDAIHWDIDPEPFNLVNPMAREVGPFVYGYDPRCCEIDGEYVVTWCNGYHGPTIGVATTTDFKTYYQKENAFLPFNRNGVMFPRKINGNYAMLSRPSDNGHTPFGDIYYSESPDLCYWGKHRYVMGTKGGWQSTKIGAGPIPIETDEGLLLFTTACSPAATALCIPSARACWTSTSRGRCCTAPSRICFRRSASMSRWATCRTWRSRAPRCPTRKPAASPSTTAARTRSSAWRSAT